MTIEVNPISNADSNEHHWNHCGNRINRYANSRHQAECPDCTEKHYQQSKDGISDATHYQQ